MRKILRRSQHTMLMFLLMMAAAAVPAASAHRPLWSGAEGEIIEIPDMSTSFALYQELSQPGQVDIYEFQAEMGDELYAGINIPQIDGLESYGVSMALVGPDLPTAESSQLPIEAPEGMGALLFPSQPSEDFYEPFTQTRFWGRQTAVSMAPADGSYYLLVWNPEGETGKYVVDVGRKEVFSAGDLLRFPVWWVKVHIYFEHTPYLLAAAGLMLAAAVTLLLRGRSRRAAGAVPSPEQGRPEPAAN